VKSYFPRIQTGALASSGENSKVAIIMGVDYEKERKLINLDKNIARYLMDSNSFDIISSKMDEKNIVVLKKYFNRAFSNAIDFALDLKSSGLDTTKYMNLILKETKLPKVKFNKTGNDILLGYKLAQYLELNIGDSIILLGQGFHGNSAFGKYKISGFLRFPTDAFNGRIIYMPIHTAQSFLSAYEINNSNDTTFFVNYVAINTDYQASIRTKDYNKLMIVKSQIESKLNDKMLTIVGWHNLDKDLIQGIEMDNNSGKIMIFVLYLIIAFGVLGTVMMMIAERRREFGVMLALGMKRNKLSIIVSLEMFFMGLIAAFVGLLVTSPIIWFGSKYPIRLSGDMAKSMDIYNVDPVFALQAFDTYMLSQLLVVVLIVAVVLVYALFKIRTIKVISSMRN